jgi:hypothetical protein
VLLCTLPAYRGVDAYLEKTCPLSLTLQQRTYFWRVRSYERSGYSVKEGLPSQARAVISHDLALQTSATLPADARRTAHARSATNRYRSWALSNAAPMVLLK